MEKSKKCALFLTIWMLFLRPSVQIYVPEEEPYQKPVTYSSGIKTSYRQPSQVQLHHNYSRVYHQNYDGHSSSDSRFERPVYNGHTYGARPPKNERLTVYVINGTRIRKNENPTRQVLIYNKSKRAPKVEIYRVCPGNATGQFVYESSCNQYLNCWKGRGYVQNCAPGTLFNPKTLECDFPEKVQCVSGPRLSVLREEKSAKTVRQVGCPKEFSGLIPNYTDCSKFINCVNGIENFMDCPPGTLFNMDKNICDFPHKANCFTGENKQIKEQHIDGKLDFASSNCDRQQSQCSKYTHRQERLSYKSNEIRCPDGADGLYKHPTDCSKFLNCAHGQTHIQSCSPGTLFNPAIKICDFPYNVRCESEDSSSGYHQQYGTHNTPYEGTGAYGSTSKYGQHQHGTNDQYGRGNGIYSSTSVYDQHQYGNNNQYNKGSGLYGNTALDGHQQYGANNQYNRGSGLYGNTAIHGQRQYDTNNQYNKGSGLYSSTTVYSQQQYGTNNQYNKGSGPYSSTAAYGQQQYDTNNQYNKATGIYSSNSAYGQQHGDTNNQYNRNSGIHTSTSLDSNNNQYNRGSGIYSSSSSYDQNQYGTNNQYNKGSPVYTDFNHRNKGNRESWGRDQNYNQGSTAETYSNSNNQYNRGSGIYSSTTNRYNENQKGWDQNYYNQASNGYAGQDQYGKGSTSFYHNGVRQNVGTYATSKGSVTIYHQGRDQDAGTYPANKAHVGVYQRGESGIYGINNRTTGGYRQGETGTNFQRQDNQNRWGNQQTNIHGQNDWERQPYHGETTGTINGQTGTYGTPTNQYGETQNNWDRNRYNQGTGQYTGNQNWGRGNGQVSSVRPVGTSQQTNWDRNRYNQGSTNYNGGRGYKTGVQYEGNNDLEQEQLYGRGTTQNQRGETSYSHRGQNGLDQNRLNGYNTQHQPDGNGYHNFPQRGGTGYNRYSKGSVQQTAWTQQNQNNIDEEPITTNYDQVVNINSIRRTTRLPYRKPYEPFYGTTEKQHYTLPQSRDYDDTIGLTHTTKHLGTTPRAAERNWPPPFPSTDVNADYVFEYDDDDDDEVILEAENSLKNGGKQNGGCGKSDFRCSNDKCIPKTLLCNGAKDCPNGKDELKCLEYVSKFSVNKNHKLAVLEKERWDNMSIATCALLCIETGKFTCRSFNYRKIDKACFLSDANEGLTGGLISYYPFDYYELISEKIDCSRKYVCSNKKCLNQSQICDGTDDCGDRMDEKGCKPKDFGYSIKLTGTNKKNEGQIEVTAFEKTGYVCDDKFGLRDADVVCKELGFDLGAIEVKSNSFYAKNASEQKPLYMMDDVTCIGNETRLMDCDFNGWGVHNCLNQEIVGVVCKTPQEKCAQDYWQCRTGRECLPLAFLCDGLLDCTDGSDEHSQLCDAPTEIRLVNGNTRNEGRVEIKHHGTWGTICDDDFNEEAAKVICRHLGYKGSAVVKKDSFFGKGTGPIWLDQVICSGNETKIEDCSSWNWGEHNCEHSEDVGVICSNSYEYERHAVIPTPKLPGVYPDKCGLRKDSIFDRDDDVHFRVVRGSVARKGDYPWQAAIRVKGKTKAAHWCGGVIISEKFVLTAAHCLTGYPKGAYVVAAGDYDFDEDEGTEQEAYIDDYYLHEAFREGHKMNNDIALIKLKGHGFHLTADVRPICLPDKNTSYDEELNCTISGFGSIESGKSAFSHTLRAGWVPIQKRQICTMPHVYGDALTDGMICAGSLDEGIDSCDGDSGGPLACLRDGVFTLYGITSWGQHCGYANKPGVYVKVAHYRKWIDDNFHKYA